jgi:hypothetical protein
MNNWRLIRLILSSIERLPSFRCAKKSLERQGIARFIEKWGYLEIDCNHL